VDGGGHHGTGDGAGARVRPGHVLGSPLCVDETLLQETVDPLLHDPGPVPAARGLLTEVDTLSGGLVVCFYAAATEDSWQVLA